MDHSLLLATRYVPVDGHEYYFQARAEYDMEDFVAVLQKYKNIFTHKKYKTEVKEIIDLICTDDFIVRSNIKERAGLVLFHNGYPLIGFSKKTDNQISYKVEYIMLVDINNYIFNKTLIQQIEDNKDYERKKKTLIEIAVILMICFMGLYFLNISKF
jgi:hypothetical protein